MPAAAEPRDIPGEASTPAFVDRLEDGLHKLVSFTFRRIAETAGGGGGGEEAAAAGGRPGGGVLAPVCDQWERYQHSKVSALLQTAAENSRAAIGFAAAQARTERSEDLRDENRRNLARARRASVTEIEMSKAENAALIQQLERRAKELAARVGQAEAEAKAADTRVLQVEARLAKAAEAEAEQLRLARLGAEQASRKCDVIAKKNKDLQSQLRVVESRREQEAHKAATQEAWLRRRVDVLEGKVKAAGPAGAVTVTVAIRGPAGGRPFQCWSSCLSPAASPGVAPDLAQSSVKWSPPCSSQTGAGGDLRPSAIGTPESSSELESSPTGATCGASRPGRGQAAALAPRSENARTGPLAAPQSSSTTSSIEQRWFGPTISGGSASTRPRSCRTVSTPRVSTAE
eukprot:SAG22_NODE_2847_length_2161_cov_1.636760_1_plen_402_part_00